MLQYLERLEGIRYFDLATALKASGEGEEMTEGAEQSRVKRVRTVQNLQSAKRAEFTDYFSHLRLLRSACLTRKELNRLRTFSATNFTVLHLNRDPVCQLRIDEASCLFQLPDLKDALCDYLYFKNDVMNPTRENSSALRRRTSQEKRNVPSPRLSFDTIRVWYTLKVQTRSLSFPGKINKPASISAAPPNESDGWELGRCDFALFINDLSKEFKGKADLIGQYERRLQGPAH